MENVGDCSGRKRRTYQAPMESQIQDGPKRGHVDFFSNSSVKINRFLVMSGTLNPEESSHQVITNLSTASVKCSHCTLWKADNFHLIEASTK